VSQQVEVDPVSHAREVSRSSSARDPANGSCTRARRAMLLGLCGLFASWILVMVPFGGIDEHDHAFRAASAARGEWAIDPVDATRGTGAFLTVPTDIVDAARKACQSLSYTEDHDCIGTPAGDDRIVASGAGRYHPLFYAVVGAAALPFDGTTALYAMRVATALLAAAFVWMAARAASSWARSRWPYLGIAAACTPVALYSSSITAPNGVEMMAALALWMTLIGLALAPPEDIRRLATYAAIAGGTLATLRPLGPLWCLLVLTAVLVAVRTEPGRIRCLLRRRAVQVGAAVVAVSAVQSAVWVISMQSLRMGGELTDHTSLAHRLGVSAKLLPMWVFQSIAAFPLRDQPTHPVVYACFLFLFLLVVVLGLRFGTTRSRVAMVLVMATMLLIPFVTTVQSFDLYGAAWQGRYGLPVAMGSFLLGAYALDRSGRDVRGPMQLTMLLLFVVAQTCAVAYTAALEGSNFPGVVLILLAAASGVVMWWGAHAQHEPSQEGLRVPD
jgi:Predicted membrane protein (DUF2142)